MLKRLVEFSLTQRLLIVGLALAVLGFGTYAFIKLPIDAYPNISPTQVKLILKVPGMTPEEVESRVIVPIEMELLGIPGQTILRAGAKYAIADITLDFEDGTDVYWARQQVAERLAAVMDSLPEGTSGGLAPISTPLSDVFMFTIEGGDLSLEARRTLLDWTIRPALRTIPGVADVNALGGTVRTFEVVPDNAALVAAGLSVSDLRSAIERSNRNDGSGRLNQGEEALVVRALGAFQTLDDLAGTVVSADNDRIIRVGDIAEVRIGSLTRYGAVTRNGTGEAVQGIVIALRGADANAVVTGVRQRLNELSGAFPPGVHIDVFYDRSDLITRAVSTVQDALLEATVLVVVLLVLFLGNLRAALVVAVTLPFAALITFIMMRLFGLSANLMSLGGLAIAIGMLVDGAVVVVENAVERLGAHKPGSKVPLIHRVYQATVEVATPVTAGILIICLVFLPLLTLQGLEGRLFSPVALTIVMALSGSLILSLSLIPVLSSVFLKGGGDHEAWLMRMLMPAYRAALRWGLAHTRIVYAVAAVMLAVAGVAYVSVGKTFMPTMDEGGILMQIAKLPSISLSRSLDGDLRVQRAVLESVPEVTAAVGRVGSDEIGLDPMGLNETDTFLVLKPKEEWRVPDKDWLRDQLREVMAGFPGMEPAFTQPIEMRVSEMLTGSRGDLAVKVFGPDVATLGRLAGEIQQVIARVDGANDVYTLANDAVEYMSLQVDREAAGRAGLGVADLQDELRARLEGTPAGIVAELNRRTPIVIRGDQDLRNTPSAFANLAVPLPDGGAIHVSDVAEITRVEGPVRVDRENASRFAVVQAYVSGRDLVGFVEEARAAVAAGVSLPAGYRLVWGGQFENQERAAARLTLVIPVALALIFAVLFATLRSLRQSALILTNIPFALVGGLLSLWLSGHYLSVPASVGFIALLGIAVLNGLVLVSHFNHLRDAGYDIADVVFEGAQRRFRPVLMTATITACGLVPLLFASGPGSEIQKPLAIVVIGGLLTSTLLTLILLPILYRAFGVGRTAAPSKEAVHG